MIVILNGIWRESSHIQVGGDRVDERDLLGTERVGYDRKVGDPRAGERGRIEPQDDLRDLSVRPLVKQTKRTLTFSFVVYSGHSVPEGDRLMSKRIVKTSM